MPRSGKVEDIASRVVTVEARARFPYARTVRLFEGFTPDEAEHFRNEYRTTFEVRAFVLEDVLIDGRTWFLRKDDVIVPNPAWHEPSTDWPPPLTTPTIPIDDPVVLGWNKSADNHFHWLVEVWPAIVGGALLWPDAALLHPPLAGFKASAMAALGLAARSRFLVSDAVHRCRRLLYLEPLSGATTFQITRLARDAYAALAATVEARSPLRKIYVSRGQAGHRRLLNEAALLPPLLHHGYAAVTLDGMTMAEQVALFRGAGAIVGLHGAGLVNAVFSMPGTCLFEVLPAGFVNPCFNTIVKAGRMDYWATVQPSLPHDHSHARDVRVDPDAFAHMLDEFDGFVAARQTWPDPLPLGPIA